MGLLKSTFCRSECLTEAQAAEEAPVSLLMISLKARDGHRNQRNIDVFTPPLSKPSKASPHPEMEKGLGKAPDFPRDTRVGQTRE